VDPVKSPLESFPKPPEASVAVRRMAQRIAAPVETFLHTETAGGILLLLAATVALVWANSPWSASYEHLWHTPVSIGVGSWSMTHSLHFWINDGLMTFFFMVAGLEIKREMVEGELSDLRRAALPVAAAVGGMVVPAVIYALFNPHPPTVSGWGVPMATDIAFAVGVLSLLGKRVPAALRILLLAVAIIDDLGAILVIALFYSSGFSLTGLAVVVAGLLFLVLIQRIGVRPGAMYLLPMFVMWAGLHEAGIHPTIAGVIVGLATPVTPWLSRQQFLDIAESALADYQQLSTRKAVGDLMLRPLRRLSVAGREAVSPVARLTAGYHASVAYVIMPLFAVANAGVSLSGVDTSIAGGTSVILGVALGLGLGKPVGIVAMTWLAVRLRWFALPRGVTWVGMSLLGLVAGIGFTMAIFIAELAFPGSPYLPLSKLAILMATAATGVAGLLVGRLALPAVSPDPIASRVTPAEAEASTEF
jgi:Na+:H+ antiporter, NhaA family